MNKLYETSVSENGPCIGFSVNDFKLQWSAGVEAMAQLLDTIVHLSVKDIVGTLPTTSLTNGDRYIYTVDNSIKLYKDGWVTITPKIGWVAYVEDVKDLYRYDGTNWGIPTSLADGDVLGPTTSTAKALPVWDAVNKKLTAGIAVGASGQIIKSNGTDWTAAYPGTYEPTSEILQYPSDEIDQTVNVYLIDGTNDEYSTTIESYSIALGTPTVPGMDLTLEIEAVDTDQDITVPLTNVVGQTGGHVTLTFDTAGQYAILRSISDKWVLLHTTGTTS